MNERFGGKRPCKKPWQDTRVPHMQTVGGSVGCDSVLATWSFGCGAWRRSASPPLRPTASRAYYGIERAGARPARRILASDMASCLSLITVAAVPRALYHCL